MKGIQSNRCAPSGARAVAQPPLGKKPEGAIPKAEAAAPSTAGALKPGPQVEADTKRPSTPVTAIFQAKTAIRKGQAEADKAKAEKAGTLGVYRSLSQDFPSMRPVNGTPEEMRKYTQDQATYYNRPQK